MNLMRIITIAAMGALAAGVLGCSWGDAQFEWPWSRQSVPVTYPAWTSPEDWPQPHTPEDPGIATTRQATSRPATGQDKTIDTGKPREITTSVLAIKGKFITVEEILQEAKEKLLAIESDDYDRFLKRVRSAIGRAIARRRDSELVFSEANARLSKAQKDHVSEQVDDILRGMIADVGGSEARLEKILAEEDITIKELREGHRRRITVQLYERIKFLPAISINRQMLLGYYKKNKDDFRVRKKVGIELIAVPFVEFLADGVGNNPTPQELAKARAEAKEYIDKADKLLKNGEDFSKVLKELSSPDIGGKLDPESAGSLRWKEVEKAAFALKQGEISGIVETPLLKNNEGTIVDHGGFYIVKVYKVQEGRITSFEDAQEEITKILRDEQFKRLTEKFSEQLAKEARIPISPDFVDTAVKQAIKLYWKPPTNP